MNSYSTAVNALLSPIHQAMTSDQIKTLNLRRTKCISDMRCYLKRIGLPHNDIRHCRNIIHITGTKGKGSTAAFCDSICRNVYGYNVGMFTSPHLIDIRERIRINGKMISEKCFGDTYWHIREKLEHWSTSCEKENNPLFPDDDDVLPTLPGYFRMLFLMALHIFATYSIPIDIVVLEVGMGGRYDATNIFNHVCTNSICGVTLIDYDHVRVLGSTLEQIAWEKGGIFLQDKVYTFDGSKIGDGRQSVRITPRPLEFESKVHSEFILRDLSNSLPSYSAKCFTISTNITSVLSILNQCAHNEGEGSQLFLVRKGDKIRDDTYISLPGDHQRINAELALAMCGAMNFRIKKSKPDNETQYYLIEKALRQTHWPGRCQSVDISIDDRIKIALRCDGAHTEKSIATCMEWFRDISRQSACVLDSDKRRRKLKTALIFNCSHERNPVTLLRQVHESKNECNDSRRVFDFVYFCPSDSSRPSATEPSLPVKILREAGMVIPALLIDDACKPSNWQETLTFIWRILNYGDNPENGRLFNDASVVANLSVSEAISHIKTWSLSAASAENNSQAVEVCVTGSLYIVGSVLTAVGWEEE